MVLPFLKSTARIEPDTIGTGALKHGSRPRYWRASYGREDRSACHGHRGLDNEGKVGNPPQVNGLSHETTGWTRTHHDSATASRRPHRGRGQHQVTSHSRLEGD